MKMNVDITKSVIAKKISKRACRMARHYVFSLFGLSRSLGLLKSTRFMKISKG